MKFLKSVLIIAFLSACEGVNKKAEIYPIYYVQHYIKEGSKLERMLGREFGELGELSNKFILNDSSAYVSAWKLTDNIRKLRKDESDLFSSVNEFKLYDWEMNEITKSVTFEGIENYPNPID